MLDLDSGTLRVIGKGSRTRPVAIGATTIRSPDRYVRTRTRHQFASLTHLLDRPQGPPTRNWPLPTLSLSAVGRVD